MQGSEIQARSGVSWQGADTRNTWPWALLVLVLVTVPFIVAIASNDQGDLFTTASSLTWLHFALLILAAAGAFLSRWRLLAESVSGWVAAALLTIGLALMPFALATATDAVVATPPSGLPQLLCGLAVAVFLWAGISGVEPHGVWHPLPLGTITGSFLALLPALTPWQLTQLPGTVTRPLLLLATVVILSQLGRIRSLTRAQRRIGGTAFALGVAWHHLVPFELLDQSAARSLILALNAVASSLVLIGGTLVLRQTMATHDRQLVELADRVTSAERGASQGEELLHEVRSAIAGIATASRLLEDNRDQLPGERADGLRRMLSTESSRLEAMLRQGDERVEPESASSFEVDAVIAPLVTGLASQGVAVEHQPSGLAVHGHPHGVAEVVHTLLANATRHAPSAHVTITSELVDDHVVIRVADNGPGIAGDVRGTLFQRSAKRHDSPGQGLGLYIAQRTIRDQGGDLLLENSHSGAVFRLRLPQMSRP